MGEDYGMDGWAEQFFLLHGNDDICVDLYGVSGKKKGILAAHSWQHWRSVFVRNICESFFSGAYKLVQLDLVFYRLCGEHFDLLFVL